ncbi:hypothetical protein BGZ73_003681 [Actinomortierella ambigua]|nr:hypothetical protein BGZ73_003681 [Actinomortierella ambigua]
MLLLVPSNKSEDKEGDNSGSNTTGGGIGGSSSGGAKVLVVLPPDTDLTSKNVLLPDILKAPQEVDGSPSRRHHHHHSHRRSSVPCLQDHLGIFQPTVEPNRPRSRHNSSDIGFERAASFSSPSSSSSRYHPFQHTPRSKLSRTPRSLRSAFRKFRPDPSPLLAPDLFGIDILKDDDVYDGELMQSLRERQIASHFNTAGTGATTSGYSSSQTSRTTSSTPSLTSGTDKSSPSISSTSSSFATQKSMGPPPTNAEGTSTSSSAKPTSRRRPGTQTRPKSRVRVVTDGDDTESLEEDDDEQEDNKHAKDNNGSPDMAHKSDKGEMDVDENEQSQPQQQDNEGHQEDGSVNTPSNGTLDSDLDAILGMASDMELIMPKFDDAYLADLDENNQPTLSRRTNSRRSFERSHSATVQSTARDGRSNSQSSSTTITSLPTLRSRTASPCADRAGPPSPDSVLRMTASPAPVSTSGQSLHAASSTLKADLTTEKGEEDDNGNKVDGLTISRDIDNLRRHRDSLKDLEEKVKESDGDSTLTKPSGGPIYFKPSAHTIPIGPEEPSLGPPSTPLAPLLHPLSTAAPRGVPPRPPPMIIQSSQWSSTRGGGATMSAIEPGSNMIYSIREATLGVRRDGGMLAPAGATGIAGVPPGVPPGVSMVPGVHPFAPLIIVPTPSSSMGISSSSPSSSSSPFVASAPPQSPPPVTAQQISMATANMTIPSPLELQEEYHYKRDLKKKYYQQLRRTTSMLERSWMGTPSTATRAASSTAAASSRRSSNLSVNTTPTGLAPLPPLVAGASSAGVKPLQAVESPEHQTVNGRTGSSAGEVLLSSPLPMGGGQPSTVLDTNGIPSHLASYYLPPSVFRTVAEAEAEAEAEVEAERRRKEEELKESFFNLPSPTPSELQQQEASVPDEPKVTKEEAKDPNRTNHGVHLQQQQQQGARVEIAPSSSTRNDLVAVTPMMDTHNRTQSKASSSDNDGMDWEKIPSSSSPIRLCGVPTASDLEPRVHPLTEGTLVGPPASHASTAMMQPAFHPFQRPLAPEQHPPPSIHPRQHAPPPIILPRSPPLHTTRPPLLGPQIASIPRIQVAGSSLSTSPPRATVSSVPVGVCVSSPQAYPTRPAPHFEFPSRPTPSPTSSSSLTPIHPAAAVATAAVAAAGRTPSSLPYHTPLSIRPSSPQRPPPYSGQNDATPAPNAVVAPTAPCPIRTNESERTDEEMIGSNRPK